MKIILLAIILGIVLDLSYANVKGKKVRTTRSRPSRKHAKTVGTTDMPTVGGDGGNGCFQLHQAIQGKNFDAYKLIMRSGVIGLINCPDVQTGMTPLLRAIQVGSVEIVTSLINEFKADITAVDKAGKNILDYAMAAGNWAINAVLWTAIQTAKAAAGAPAFIVNLAVAWLNYANGVLCQAIPTYNLVTGAAALLAGASVNTRWPAPNPNWCVVSNKCPYLAIQQVVTGSGSWPNPPAWLYAIATCDPATITFILKFPDFTLTDDRHRGILQYAAFCPSVAWGTGFGILSVAFNAAKAVADAAGGLLGLLG